MNIRCSNPDCQHEFVVSDSQLGAQITCPRCGTSSITGELDLDDLTSELSELPEVVAEDEEEKSRFEATIVEAAPAKSTDPLIGLTLGGCRITSKLGEGGMGAVYRGRHEGLDIDVAMKVLPKHLAEKNPEFIERFQREARVAARLNHANVVNVMNVGEEQGQRFIIMEFVEGEDLKEYIVREGPLEVSLAVDLIKQIFSALDAGHSVGILHRDIKPANVFLKTERGKLQAKLGDFGLAKIGSADGESPDSGNTMSGMMMGTPHYISPEQAEDAKRVDARADIYSMGCMLYYLLCGRVPYDGESFVQIVLQHLQSPVPDARQIRPDIPPDLSVSIQRMMAKRADDRFQTAADVLDVLNAIEKSLESGVPTGIEATMPLAPSPTPPPTSLPSADTSSAETVVCPNTECGKPNPADAKWCEYCGQAFFEDCRSCNHEVRALRPFCPYCRYDLSKSREIFTRIAACKEHLEAKQHALAIEEANAILKLEEEDAEGLEFKQKAEAALQEAADLRAHAEEAFTLKDYDGITEFLQSALEITPHDEELRTQLDTLPERIKARECGERLEHAREALENHLPRKARASYQEALEIDPDSEEAQEGKENCAEILRQVDEARQEAESTSEEDLQANCDAWGRVLELDADHDEAEQHYGVLSERLTAVKEHIRAAIELRQEKEWESSFKAWEQALEIWPTGPEASIGLQVTRCLQEANDLLDEKRLPGALEKASAALVIDAECPSAIKLRDEIEGILDHIDDLKAKAEEATSPDQFDAALEMIREAIDLYPHEENLHLKRADLEERIRVRDFEQSLAEGKAAWEGYFPRQAFTAFRKATELDPASQEAQEGLERCQGILDQVEELTASAQQREQDGEIDAAISVWEQIVEIDPESEEAPENRDRLTGELNKAKEFIAAAEHEEEVRDWGNALGQWEEALKHWPACAKAQEGRDKAAELFQQFSELFSQSKQLAADHKLTSALEIHRQALAIGISQEALALQDEMVATHRQAEVLAEAGTGAGKGSLWREAAEKLRSARNLNREAIEESDLKQAKDLAKKIEKSLKESQSLLSTGYFERAETEARKGLELGPDLKLEEIASEAGRRALRVQEASDIAAQCEDEDPPQAIALWEEVLNLQSVHASAKENIQRLGARIQEASGHHEQAVAFQDQKKWSKTLAAAQEAQRLNPAIPGIDVLIKRAADNYRKQKIIIAAAAAVVLIIISVMVVRSVQASMKRKAYATQIATGNSALTKEDWSAAVTAFDAAKGIFPGAAEGEQAAALEVLASSIESAEKELSSARKLAKSPEKWSEAAQAFAKAHNRLKDQDLSGIKAQIKTWLGTWEDDEYALVLQRFEAEQETRAKVQLWKDFLANYPDGKYRQGILKRNKALLESDYRDAYGKLVERFNASLENEDDSWRTSCEEIITKLEKLVVEVRKDNIQLEALNFPEAWKIGTLQKNLDNAETVRAIKKAVRDTKSRVRRGVARPPEIAAAWTALIKQYENQSEDVQKIALDEVRGELATNYNEILRDFGDRLDAKNFGEAQSFCTEAKAFCEATASLAAAIRDEDQPEALNRRLGEKKAEVEDGAFLVAQANTGDKEAREKIAVWDKFLNEYPEEQFGKRAGEARSLYQKAVQEDYETRLVTAVLASLGEKKFDDAQTKWEEVNRTYQNALKKGCSLTVPEARQPEALEQRIRQERIAHEEAEAFAKATAGSANQAAEQKVAIWSEFLTKFRGGKHEQDAGRALSEAYKDGHGVLMKDFNDNLAKNEFGTAATGIKEIESWLKRAEEAKSSPVQTNYQDTGSTLRKQLADREAAYKEEQAFEAAKAASDKAIGGQKFDDALAAWDKFLETYAESDAAKAARSAALKQTVDWFVTEGQKTLGQNDLPKAYKQVKDALRYSPAAANALELQKKIMPKLIAQFGIFEAPTEKEDPHGKAIRKDGDDQTGFPLEIRHKATGLHLVFVPAGDFTMGSATNEGKDEHQHPVTISKPVYLGKYEVTFKETKLFNDDGGYLTAEIDKEQKKSDDALSSIGEEPAPIDSWKKPAGFQPEDNLPAIHMNWIYAQEFVNWLNKKHGLKNVFQLPTEAQWEYACRAGTKTKYFWGDDETQASEYANVNSRAPTPVGSKKPNPFGLYDMLGNAQEWCRDWYGEDFYKTSPKADPVGPQSGEKRVCRGGAFIDRNARNFRIARRSPFEPTYFGLNSLGFRICVDAAATLSAPTNFAAGGR